MFSNNGGNTTKPAREVTTLKSLKMSMRKQEHSLQWQLGVRIAIARQSDHKV